MTDRLDTPQPSLSDILATHARHHPGKEAVVCGATRRSWAEFDANISRIAHALRESGVGRGDVVAVMMGNSAEMLECLFGAVRAGACVAPLSGLLTGEQLEGLVKDCGAGHAFVSAEFRDRVELFRERAGLRGWVSHGFEGPGWTPLPDFAGGQPTTPPAVTLEAEDPFNVIYSSGTTGLPKGILQSHRARTHWAWSNAVEMSINAGSRALTTTALYSNGTWLMMLPVLFAGGTLVAIEAFDPVAFLETVARERITHTFMVPTQYIMILDRPELETADLSTLQIALCAGSSLRRDVKRRVIERITPNLIELYGFSEGFATMLKPWEHEEKFDTVGTPVLGFELRILDEDGNECPPNQPGEIAGYGAGMMLGYLNRPDLTAELIWRDERGRSFVRSGDVGSVDEDGYLRILDRKKDMIISGGFNVFPTDVEAVVGQHPDVSDVAVIGVPHEKWGESCHALVIPRPGVACDPDAVRDWANERLAKHQRLAGLELREDFPRNALGKVIKKELRAPFWKAG
ncbi:MAG: class I adenylate-forming enzyme family protein [Pseudomonadota bacterium]